MTKALRSVPPPAASPSRIGRFDLVREIGRGASGVVYEAVDRESGARLALKTLRALDGEMVLQLKSEFRALRDIEHPNLIRLHELACDGDRWFFTMELIEGEGLASYVTGRGDASDPSSSTRPVRTGSMAAALFDEGRLRDALAQLARGLEALHAIGKVHRDVKPENVLVGRDGRVVVIDLGLVREETAAPEEDIVGTVPYLAPEQVVGERIRAACDWYAVGVILYVCLTARYPFLGPMEEVLRRKLKEDPPPPSAIADGVPPDLDALCMDLLRRDPAARAAGADVALRLRSKRTSAFPPTRAVAGASSVFVGRAAPLAALVEAYEARRDGGATAALITGESGIGKSALVARFVQEITAGDPDAIVLAGRCHEREAVPYKALDGVIDDVSRYFDALASAGEAPDLPEGFGLLRQVFPVLQRVDAPPQRSPSASALDGDAVGMNEGRARFFGAARAMFASLAARRPLVVVIEDMQWADEDSRALLAALLRQPGAPPLLLVMTARATAGETPVIAGLPPGTREVALGRLSSDEGLALARALLAARGRTDEDVARAIADEAAGHPLFLDELARHAQSVRGLVAAHVSLDDVLGQRIDHLEPGPRRLLDVLAVAGIPMRPSAIARAADVTPADLAALVRTLRIGHLARTVARDGVDAIEVYHDRVRDAAYHRIDAIERRAHHERVARALEEGARADDDALATQWIAAGDAGRGLRYLLRAADAAYAAFAFDRAARLFAAGLLLAEADVRLEEDAKQRARARLAEAYAALGRMPEAARAFATAARSARDKGEALDLRRRQAEALINSGAFAEGEAVMGEVLAAVGLKPERSRLAALGGFLGGRARLWWRGLDFVERAEREVPTRELLRLDTCWGIAAVFGTLDVIRSSDFQTKTLLFALDAGEPGRLARALALHAPITAARGASTKAKTEATLALAGSIAARIEMPQAEALVLVARGFTDLLQGSFRAGLASTVRGTTMLRENAGRAFFEARTGETVHVWSLCWLGELAKLAAQLDPFVAGADARGDLYTSTTMRLGPPSIALLRSDDPVAARATMKAAMAKWSQPGFHTPHYWGVYAEAQVDLYERRGHAAWTRLAAAWPSMRRSLMFFAQVIHLEATFLRARAALATAVEQAALEGPMLRAARRDAQTLAASDAPYGPPLASLVRASIDAIGAREDAARAHLRQAIAGLDAVGMRLHAEASRWRMGQLVGGDEGRALVETAEAWARGEGVASPARMFAMVAPGFVASSSARPRLAAPRS